MFRVPSRTTAYRRVFMGDFADARTLVFDTHLALQADPGKRELQNLLCSLYYAYIIFLCKKNEPRSYIDQAG